MILGYREKDFVGADGKLLPKTEGKVYFNSNDYNGDQFLTDAAMEAGYTRTEVKRDDSILKFGIASLVREDTKSKALLAEEILLSNLVLFESARSAMRAAIASSAATGGDSDISWSSEDREWLFKRLVDMDDEVVHSSPSMLKEHMAALPDAPDNAFAFIGSSALEKVKGEGKEEGAHGNLERMARTAQPTTTATSPQDVPIGRTDPSTPKGEIEAKALSFGGGVLDDDETDAETIDIEAETISDTPGLPGRPESNTAAGTLDRFFEKSVDLFAATYDETVPRELRAGLQVQGALAALLRFTAMGRLSVATSNLSVVSTLLTDRLALVDQAEGIEPEKELQIDSGIEALDSMNLEELQTHSVQLLEKVRDLHRTVAQLGEAEKRINVRLMDCSTRTKSEGRMSVAQQQEASRLADEYLASLPPDYKPTPIPGLGDARGALVPDDDDDDDDDAYADNSEEDGQANFEEDMLAISREWADWMDDGYTWSPDDVNMEPPDFLLDERFDSDEGDEETLTETLARLDKEWGEFLDDPPDEEQDDEVAETTGWHYDNSMVGNSAVVDEPDQNKPDDQFSAWQ